MKRTVTTTIPDGEARIVSEIAARLHCSEASVLRRAIAEALPEIAREVLGVAGAAGLQEVVAEESPT